MPRAWAIHPQPCAAPDHVQLIEHDADRLSIRADLACDGTVVLSDTFYPGWRARVDHRPAEITRVNGAMRPFRSPAVPTPSPCATAPSPFTSAPRSPSSVS